MLSLGKINPCGLYLRLWTLDYLRSKRTEIKRAVSLCEVIPRSSIVDIGNKRATPETATLITISRCGACARDCTSCRLIRSAVGRRSLGEHISGLSRRQHAATTITTTTNHNETFHVVVGVVVVGENCFRCRRTEGATAHLTYDTDVTRPVWMAHGTCTAQCKRYIVSVATSALCTAQPAALKSTVQCTLLSL